ncbi:tyrosine-protein kinase Mer-like [Amphiura filiformis]|uniref:tyrosine-protein kinase Mer-like n=1 Tax=Amphiura filiformis TaxID=82378 RepID=UPI003B2258D6
MLVKWRLAWAILLHITFFSATLRIPASSATDCSLHGRYPPSTEKVAVSQAINLSCDACTPMSETNLNFTWQHNGVPIQSNVYCMDDPHYCESGRFCVGDIFIPSATVFHRGRYTCQAICRNGESNTENFEVEVKGPPHFVRHPLSQNISRGDDVDLVCDIESDPAAQISWLMKNGDTIHSASSKKVAEWQTRSTTKLKNVTESCKIFCQANNSFGTVNSTIAHINIKEVPDSVKSVVMMNTTSSSVKLSWTCGFDGYSPITTTHIMWYPSAVLNDVTVVTMPMANLTNLTSDMTSTPATPEMNNVTVLTMPMANLTNLTSDGYMTSKPAMTNVTAVTMPMANLTNVTSESYMTSTPATPVVTMPMANLTNLTSDIYMTSTSATPALNNVIWDNMPMVNLTNLTSDSYMISNLHPATSYLIRVAVSNDQGMSNWSDALEVKTNYTVPPAPSQVHANCFDETINISWSLIPAGRTYGKIKKYIVTLLDMANIELSHFIVKDTNHKLVLNNNHKLLVSTYKISVCGVTEGGTGPKMDLVYHCNATTRPDVKQTTATEINAPDTQQSPNKDDNIYTIVLILLSVIAAVILGTCIFSTYYHRMKKRKKQITLNNVPIRAYVEEAETTNAQLDQSHDPQTDLRRLQCHDNPRYQTHIIKLQDQPLTVDLPAESATSTHDKSRLVRMSSEEYENCAAGFAQLINLAEECKKQFYEVLIPIESVTTGKVVGEGQFGEVSFGYLNRGSSNETKVAIKKMKDITDSRLYETFIKEGIITTAFDHRNVLAIIGMSITEDDSGCIMPLVVMPFMENGDLKTYLYNARVSVSEKIEMGLDQLIGFMLDIAEGMEYLASKKFVHRDLAARNCMLDSQFTVKIADFGLTRSVCDAEYYQICKNGKSCKIPVKWVAIESLRDGKFTIASDVWAYGVTMWEIITRSQIPYPGVSNCSVYEYLLKGTDSINLQNVLINCTASCTVAGNQKHR